MEEVLVVLAELSVPDQFDGDLHCSALVLGVEKHPSFRSTESTPVSGEPLTGFHSSSADVPEVLQFCCFVDFISQRFFMVGISQPGMYLRTFLRAPSVVSFRRTHRCQQICLPLSLWGPVPGPQENLFGST